MYYIDQFDDMRNVVLEQFERYQKKIYNMISFVHPIGLFELKGYIETPMLYWIILIMNLLNSDKRSIKIYGID